MSRIEFPAAALSDAARFVGLTDVPVITVTGAADDSREVRPGDIFFCFRGERHDAHDLAPAAMAAGAAAVVVDHLLDTVPTERQVLVGDVRKTVGPFVSALLGHPSRSIRIIGVTGTNGKTSTVSFIAQILATNGFRPHVIGTLTGARTTPEAVELQGVIRDAVAAGSTHVVMEVSSHALVMGRVDGIVFDCAVFTNLGHDHLDLHGTREAYFAAKASLFDPARCRRAVVNVDDEHGHRLAGSVTVPVEACSRSALSDVRVSTRAVTYRWRGCSVTVPVGGDFTVDNSMLALVVASGEGIDDARSASACGSVEPVAGRFEPVETGGNWDVVVDYAHTPDALERLLQSARRVAAGRVIVVFGCGGNRDRAKRPEMGEVADRLADMVVVTSDNPRDEAPRAIIDEIVAGTGSGGADISVCEDRAEAIGIAVTAARDGDIVVIAGKGHETYQEVNGKQLPFSDSLVARAAVGRRGGAP